MPNSRPVDILFVEDNPGDVVLFTDVINDIQANVIVHIARDGIEAMQYLHQEAPFRDVPQPAIILLDLNLPRKDGREVLREIKSDPVLALRPVIVFSGSDAPQDISTSYTLGANCYITKPRDLYSYTETMHCLLDFWLNKVKLPESVKQG